MLNGFQTAIENIISESSKAEITKEIVTKEPFLEYSDNPKEYIWLKVSVNDLEVWVYRDGVDVTVLDRSRVNISECGQEKLVFESIDYESSEELINDFKNKFFTMLSV